MCWAVPAEILSVDGMRARVRAGAVEQEIGLDLIDSPRIGDFVVVHAGYAIQKVSAEDADFTRKLLSGENPF